MGRYQSVLEFHLFCLTSFLHRILRIRDVSLPETQFRVHRVKINIPKQVQRIFCVSYG